METDDTEPDEPGSASGRRGDGDGRDDNGRDRTGGVDGVVLAVADDPESDRIEIDLAVDDLLTTVQTLEAALGSESIRNISKAAAGGPRRPERATLTDKQDAALQAAYEGGYFEQPRRQTATEIADSLGVSHSTFLRHLRAAQRKAFRNWFE